MNKFELVLFDLDGTLTDPKTGITNSVMYALKKKGYKIPERDRLLFFIGPPLIDSFRNYLKLSTEQAAEMVEIYREYFSTKGIYENSVIDGAENLLKNLKNSGVKLALATSKPKVFADEILKHFDLLKYFDITVGSNLDGTLVDKGEVISTVLQNFKNTENTKIAMVGDRCFDIIGARQNGIMPIGVLCGYGEESELTSAGAQVLAKDLTELNKILL